MNDCIMRHPAGSALKIAWASALVLTTRVAGAQDVVPTPAPTRPMASSPSPVAPNRLESAPETLPYEPNQPIPVGYHVETSRAGPVLLIVGGILLAAAGTVTLMGISAANSNDADSRDLGHGIEALGFIGMSVALPLVIVGAVIPRRVLQRNETTALRVRLAPRLAGGATGIGIVGTF